MTWRQRKPDFRAVRSSFAPMADLVRSATCHCEVLGWHLRCAIIATTIRSFSRKNVPVFKGRRSSQEARWLRVSGHNRFSFYDASRCRALCSRGRSSRICRDAPYFQWRPVGASGLTFHLDRFIARPAQCPLLAERTCHLVRRMAAFRGKAEVALERNWPSERLQFQFLVGRF